MEESPVSDMKDDTLEFEALVLQLRLEGMKNLPRPEELKNNEFGETSQRRARLEGTEEYPVEDLLDDTIKPSDLVSLLAVEAMKNTPLRIEMKTNDSGKKSQRRVKFQDPEEYSSADLNDDNLESEVPVSFSRLEQMEYALVQMDESGDLFQKTVKAEEAEENLSEDVQDDSLTLGSQDADRESKITGIEEAPHLLDTNKLDPPSKQTKSGAELKGLTEPTLDLDKFWEGMNNEWKKRLDVIKSLKAMRNNIRFNDSQCDDLIKTYLNAQVLTRDPEHYLKLPHSVTLDISSLLQSSLDAFVELTRVMRHGEILVRDCTSDEFWIRAALTRMTVVPKRTGWKVVTPFFLHLQEFKWIVRFVGVTVTELLSASEFFEDEDELKGYLGMFSITLYASSSHTDMEKNDRKILLERLLEFINAPLTSTNAEITTNLELAKFMAWRLQGESTDIAQPPTFSREMEHLENIGSGAFGIVCKKKWLDVEVAVKELRIEQDFNKEIEFVDLQHPHIVPVLDYWFTTRGWLTMELMEMSLWEHIIKQPPNRSISQAIDLMIQIAEAMEYIGDSGVLHRDLKAENVLVTRCGCGDQECVVAKLADFGISKYKPDQYASATKNRGTKSWMAPEVMGLAGEVRGNYRMEADVYSFAITCSEILTGKVPFEGILKRELWTKVREGLRPTLPKSCPTILSAYIRKCWATNPKERPKHFSEICKVLRYCKEILLRNGLPSRISSVNEDDARLLLTHFGLQWCLEKDESGPRITDAVYEHVVALAIQDRRWMDFEDSKDRQSVELKLANYMGNWTGPERQYMRAVEVLKNLAEDDRNPEAIWRLGYCYELGLGVDPPDFDKAAFLYESASELDPQFGSPYVELGRCFALGRGKPRDIERASWNWHRAIELQAHQMSTIKSVEEQIAILIRREEGVSGLLTLPTKCRERAAYRLLDMTITSSGRNLLMVTLAEIISQFNAEYDELATEVAPEFDSGVSSKPTEELQRFDDEAQGGEFQNKAVKQDEEGRGAERSELEKFILEEILQYMSKEERVILKEIFRDLSAEVEDPEEAPFKEKSELPEIKYFLTEASSPKRPTPKFVNLTLFLTSLFVWILCGLFFPRGRYSIVFLSSARFPFSPSWKASFCARYLDTLW